MRQPVPVPWKAPQALHFRVSHLVFAFFFQRKKLFCFW